MRILHVISSLDPRGGGPSEAVRQLGSELVRDGTTQVEVATLDSPDAPWLANFPFPVHALGPAYLGYRYTPRLVPWLRANADQFDCVIANGIWQYTSFGVWRALRAAAIPYFVFPHGMLDPWFKGAYPLKHLKKALYWKFLEARVFRDAAAVLFTCEEERRLAQTTFRPYRSTERIAPLGIAVPGGDPEVQRAAFKRQLPELAGHRILLFLGRLHEKKGCDLLIRAFAEVCQARITSDEPPLHLMLAGPCADANYLESLKQLAGSLNLPILDLPSSDHQSPIIELRSLITSHSSQITHPLPRPSVSFPGMLSGDFKWGALRAAEAFVLPSHQENFGIAVAEALACGTPVLISDKVNIWREIEGARAGCVQSDDLMGTKQLLSEWVWMSDTAKTAMGTNAKTCFEQHFEIGAAAQTFMATVQGLLSKRSENAAASAIL